MTGPKVIAVANAKGGVAKTTTCLSLGGGLADQGQLVLMVDLDPQAHLTSSLGVRSNEVHRTVCDVLLAQSSLTAISRETGVYGLDLAPANNELVIIDKMLYRHPGYEYRLKTDIEGMRHSPYDVILMDCPPTFGTVTINAMTAADLLVIPMPCEHYAVQSLVQMLDMVSVTRRKTNPRLSYRLLVTMYDMRNRVHPMILEYLRDRFPAALCETMIQVDTKLRESPAFGKPITEYAPKTRAAGQYRTLAKELMGYLKLRTKEKPESLAATAGAAGSRESKRTREGEGGDSASLLVQEPSGEGLPVREAAPGGNGQ
jgi:chromosome partitioning protein